MTGKLVIAVDAVRKGRYGPFVAAAVVYRENPPEPLFRFVDGRGVRRDSYLFRRPELIKPKQSAALATFVRTHTLAVVPYCLPPEKTPKNARVARLIAMFWAVRKVADRLKYCHAEELSRLTAHDLRLLVSGTETLHTKQFYSLQQTAVPLESDWRLQVARFCALNAFPQLQ